MDIPGIETVDYREERQEIPLVFKQHICEHAWSVPEINYFECRLVRCCKNCRLLMVVDVDHNDKPIPGTYREIYDGDVL